MRRYYAVWRVRELPQTYYDSLNEYGRQNDVIIDSRVVIRTKALNNCVAKKSNSWMEFNNDELISYGFHNILFDGAKVQSERVLKRRGPLGFYRIEIFARISIDGVPLCEKLSKDGFSESVLDCEMMGEKFIEDKCHKAL